MIGNWVNHIMLEKSVYNFGWSLLEFDANVLAIRLDIRTIVASDMRSVINAHEVYTKQEDRICRCILLLLRC